jgi:bifunctional UDP-N-acetylglucosamine pyrophosphorylase/glucosamine-1-phosphate N-acetyltransferase
MKAVVLAAGKGMRMRPLTEKVPKAMVQLNGRPLLDWTLGNLANAGVEEIIIVVGHLSGIIENHFGKEYRGIPLRYVFQKEQKGTADAVALVKEHMQGHFIVLNADVITEGGLIKELAAVDEFDIYDAVVVGREVRDPWRYGVLSYSNGELHDIVEKPPVGEEPGNVVNAGVYRFNEKIFGAIKLTELSSRNEYEIVDSIKLLINSGGKVRVKIYKGRCFDIGTVEELKNAENELK